MPVHNHARHADQQRRSQTQRRIVALSGIALAVVVLLMGWSAANSDYGANTSGAISPQSGANPADTDIAGLQAAEKGTAGEPALVWFHADW